MKNLKKLTREAQKAIVGKGVQSCPPTGCYNFYLSDGDSTCIASGCPNDYGTIVTVNGRSQCCF
ncbi:hypothetical protein QX233_19925 [Chryseobacterium gambrini]|uniref:Uncharacterized protein n=1 Tax=Chryseobacterium gambrini TaxID=373672 RepID=A0AAJ1R6A5_9FLAO|nr:MULTISPECIES: hypothetical protein [Chryseobacterium]MDN4014745.1 hypothetical protein [Chryseobacterium gambrini]MDN4031828.1 hypothetical protein [Chryseobacterium gambrini]QWA37993.1 hypothetical protein KKI44_19195 [Chryseobacterium sp. ZHDP1]